MAEIVTRDMVIKANWSVHPNPRKTESMAGSARLIEVPKSNCNKSLKYRKNCERSGSFNPFNSRNFSLASSEASRGKNKLAGSPVNLTRKKTSITKIKSDTALVAALLIKKLVKKSPLNKMAEDLMLFGHYYYAVLVYFIVI